MGERELLRKSSLKTADSPGQIRKKKHVLITIPDSDRNKPSKARAKITIIILVVLVFVAAICGYFIGKAEKVRRDLEPVDPDTEPGPSASKLRTFTKAAVCTDAPYCSSIGNDILLRNGSAVDAAIAAMFCNGILNQQSMGIGGGFFMMVYIKDEQKAYAVNAREKAPMNASSDMYHCDSDLASKGPLAVAVPGEVRGMWEAHKRWGKLPWATLIMPTLQLCLEGFKISRPMYDGLEAAPYIKNDPNLMRQYVNPITNAFFKPGTTVKPSQELCNTLNQIASKGGDELYTGHLSNLFLQDLQRAGTIITKDDLERYQPKISEPVKVDIGNGHTVYSPPPPSSGIILINILNILRGYNFNNLSISTNEQKTLTYHRIIESFKFAYATRTKLGDMDFLEMEKLLHNVSDPATGSRIRMKINDDKTSNDTNFYGVDYLVKPDHGTAHISVIAENGDAVSVTSSVNYYYGAGFTTLKTGVVMNNVMDDFSSPGFKNYFGLKPSPANYIQPGKRPLSSMSPSIIVDSSGNAKMVVGASGGTKITTAVALGIIRKMWFDQSIKEAVDAPRIHHQIFPMYIEYEYGVPAAVINGLKDKGHGIQRYRGRGSIICALYRNETGIFANSDFRKGGDVAGM